MLHLDDVQLYDLSEAGGLLFKDPVRLAREARLGKVPATPVEDGLALPAPWVDAAAGASDVDPEALASYWLARLAPPSPSAVRPRRPLDKLEALELLDPGEAARRLCATPAALERLDRDGTVPSLRIEGAAHYDAVLVDLVAREHEGEAVRARASARRAAVRAWARFEYGTPEEVPPPPASFRAPPREAASADEAPAAPSAFEIPADLALGDISLDDGCALDEDRPSESEPASGLMEVEGFETVDED